MRIGNVQYGPMRGKCTRAAKTGNPDRIAAVARETVEFFNAHGWPDNWHSWCRLLADALPWGHPTRAAVEDYFNAR